MKYKDFTIQLSINLELKDDEAIQEEATRQLPDALMKIGEQVGEATFGEIQKSFKLSFSEKKKFIREAGKNFKKSASSKERRDIKELLVQHIKDLIL